ncbi:MAG: hypothetical protein JW963_21175 [Anaerolineales bacterium]|nr:hypothetical protein [Anaerolineales bacterium]
MELNHYFDILKRRALIIIIVTAVTILVVSAAGFIIPPVYTASATVRVIMDVGITDFLLRDDYNQRLLNTYSHVLESEPILQEAITRLSPRTSLLTIDELSKRVSVDVVPDTELIAISVEDRDPALARDLANELANLFVEFAQNQYMGSSKSTLQIVEEQLNSMRSDLEHDRRQLADMLSQGQVGSEIEILRQQITSKEDAYNRLLDQYETARLNGSLRANSVTIVAPATLPQKPSNAMGMREIGLGLILGLFGGIGLALVLENIDTHIHSPEQLERLTNLPVLGVVPRGTLPSGSFGRIDDLARNHAIKEAYRLLSINLMSLTKRTSAHSLLITSANLKESITMVSINLAQALAEQGQVVLLMDCDLRHPDIGKEFDIQNGPGLSGLLNQSTSRLKEIFNEVAHPTEQSNLFVVSSGPESTSPTTLLASGSMDRLMDYLDAQGQMTLLGTPPVLGLADVSVLAPKVNGVIFVVTQDLSSRDTIYEALKQLNATRARVIGLVFVQRSSKDWEH